MTKQDPEIHVCDDWVSIAFADRNMVLAAQHALSTGDHWAEIVPGINTVAVQFDPALTSPEDASNIVRDQLTNAGKFDTNLRPEMVIPVCYDPQMAPDRQFVAKKLGIATEALPSWHTSHAFDVAMIGFMPGFAYLEAHSPIPSLGRLSEPRQLVPAGSIGIIGRQSCIYSFDSPGGWPIIGRTPLSLFNAATSPPALLSAGQSVRFEAISKDEFNDRAAEEQL